MHRCESIPQKRSQRAREIIRFIDKRQMMTVFQKHKRLRSAVVVVVPAHSDFADDGIERSADKLRRDLKPRHGIVKINFEHFWNKCTIDLALL